MIIGFWSRRTLQVRVKIYRNVIQIQQCNYRTELRLLIEIVNELNQIFEELNNLKPRLFQG